MITKPTLSHKILQTESASTCMAIQRSEPISEGHTAKQTPAPLRRNSGGLGTDMHTASGLLVLSGNHNKQCSKLMSGQMVWGTNGGVLVEVKCAGPVPRCL